MARAGRILVVDDDPTSLYTVEMLLAPDGHEVAFASSGPQALEAVDEEPPDVILSDVMMPGMTGFDLCRSLKAAGRTRHVPLVLITALDDKADLVRGLDAGADDFICKPVNGPELRARVRSMLRLKSQHDELREAMALREEMAELIVHDMRTPLSAIRLYAELLSLKASSDPEQTSRLTSAILDSSRLLDGLLTDMLLMAKLRAGKITLERRSVNLPALLQSSVSFFDPLAEAKDIRILLSTPAEGPALLLDEKLVARMVDNLLSNALKFSPPGGQIEVTLDYAGNGSAARECRPTARLSIIDEGPGIPPADRQRIFERFETVAHDGQPGPQIGLGLTLCQLVVEAHGGRITVGDNQPSGAVLTVEL